MAKIERLVDISKLPELVISAINNDTITAKHLKVLTNIMNRLNKISADDFQIWEVIIPRLNNRFEEIITTYYDDAYIQATSTKMFSDLIMGLATIGYKHIDIIINELEHCIKEHGCELITFEISHSVDRINAHLTYLREQLEVPIFEYLSRHNDGECPEYHSHVCSEKRGCDDSECCCDDDDDEYDDSDLTIFQLIQADVISLDTFYTICKKMYPESIEKIDKLETAEDFNNLLKSESAEKIESILCSTGRDILSKIINN